MIRWRELPSADVKLLKDPFPEYKIPSVETKTIIAIESKVQKKQLLPHNVNERKLDTSIKDFLVFKNLHQVGLYCPSLIQLCRKRDLLSY